MLYDVFISHSHEDKTTADAVCAFLEAAAIRCWIAPRDIVPGTEYPAAIVHAIDNCRIMILIFSSKANKSRQITREVERAINKSVPILPVRIEDVLPTESMAYFIGPVHWLDALTPPLERHLKALVEDVGVLLQANPSAAVQDDQGTQNLTSRRGPAQASSAAVANTSRLRIKALSISLLVVAIIGAGAFELTQLKHTDVSVANVAPAPLVPPGTCAPGTYFRPPVGDGDQTRIDCFAFHSLPADPDPGLRIWRRQSENTWTETYPSGFTSEGILERSRDTVNGCLGSIVGPKDQPNFSVFIPDRGCPGMMVLFRINDGHWNVLNPMLVSD